jgi:sulfide dehydrogenase cytochrome subunit
MHGNQPMRRRGLLAFRMERGLKLDFVLSSLFCAFFGLGMALTVQAVHAQAAPAPSAAESAIAARVLASTCANCHGMDGRSAGGMPMLAGYPRDAMVSTMQAFRSGQRPATIMHQLAKGYTDDQIALVAEHFSRLKALP